MQTYILHEGEELRDIPNYEGLYAATTFGRIWNYPKLLRGSYEGKWITSQISHKGYLRCHLFNGKWFTKTIHRLVSLTWIPNLNNLPEVNHIDGIKINNLISNLEWCTNQENINHAVINTLRDKYKTSDFLGVSWRVDRGNWTVRIRTPDKYKALGSYMNELDAAQAWNNYVIKNNLDKPLNEIPTCQT